MSRILVCPLAKVEETIAASGATSVVSLLALKYHVPDFGPIEPERRLHLPFSDIVVATASHILPEADHIAKLLVFIRIWDRRAPLLIHCYAGVSRSTAAAFIALCALDPDTAEIEHARRLRIASPAATPNSRLIALADTALARAGRMTAAITAIGRGADCFQGNVFALEVPRRSAGSYCPSPAAQSADRPAR